MNFDNIRFGLQYWKLKAYLMKELGYSKEDAAETIADLRKMEPVILHMFLVWFKTSELPKNPVNGVRIQDIIKQCSMDTVAAFLSLNWVLVEPDAAKYSLSHPVDTIKLTSEDEEKLREIAKKRGWEIQGDKAENEDTSDINDPLESPPKEDE